jgi:hypothetical protein
MMRRSLLATAFGGFLAIAGIAGAGCDENARSVRITVGQTVEGRLERGDWTDVFADGSFTDLYDIHLAAGEQITVDLRSDDVDTYLSLMRGPGDQLVDSDDVTEGGPDTNSRVSYRSQADGVYYIAATTYRAGATGSYTLSVTRAPANAPGPSVPSKTAPEKTASPR